jgi:hypothetical protein
MRSVGTKKMFRVPQLAVVFFFSSGAAADIASGPLSVMLPITLQQRTRCLYRPEEKMQIRTPAAGYLGSSCTYTTKQNKFISSTKQVDCICSCANRCLQAGSILASGFRFQRIRLIASVASVAVLTGTCKRFLF